MKRKPRPRRGRQKVHARSQRSKKRPEGPHEGRRKNIECSAAASNGPDRSNGENEPAMSEAFESVKTDFGYFHDGINRCLNSSVFQSADLRDAYGRLARLWERYHA